MLSRITLSGPKSLTRHPFADAANVSPAVCEVTPLSPESFPVEIVLLRERNRTYVYVSSNANLGRACGVSRSHTAVRFTRINLAGQNVG